MVTLFHSWCKRRMFNFLFHYLYLSHAGKTQALSYKYMLIHVLCQSVYVAWLKCYSYNFCFPNYIITWLLFHTVLVGLSHEYQLNGTLPWFFCLIGFCNLTEPFSLVDSKLCMASSSSWIGCSKCKVKKTKISFHKLSTEYTVTILVFLPFWTHIY